MSSISQFKSELKDPQSESPFIFSWKLSKQRPPSRNLILGAVFYQVFQTIPKLIWVSFHRNLHRCLGICNFSLQFLLSLTNWDSTLVLIFDPCVQSSADLKSFVDFSRPWDAAWGQPGGVAHGAEDLSSGYQQLSYQLFVLYGNGREPVF